MPADGSSARSSDSDEPGKSERASPPVPRWTRRSARLRRFVLVALALTGVSHVVPVLGAMLFVGPLVAVLGGALVAVVAFARLSSLMKHRRRPRLARLFDEPILAHWCAALLSLFLFPCVEVLLLALHVFGAMGHASAFDVTVRAAFGTYAFSALVSVWGVAVRRRWVRVANVTIPVVGLPEELRGYRIAQLSDLHIGNYDPLQRGLAWAKMTNALGADLIAVTGDLVTTGTAFYEDVAEVLGALSAKDGVFVSMGNHDQWDPDDLCRKIRAHGTTVLRNAQHVVRRGEASLVVAGVDDVSTRQDDLDGTLAGRPPGAPVVLLSHYPEFFEAAAERDVDLVLSGHTHGGQIAMPFAVRHVSLSRIARQRVHGLHRLGRSFLYVHAGLGTTGPPIRLGVAPEIAVFTLELA